MIAPTTSELILLGIIIVLCGIVLAQVFIPRRTEVRYVNPPKPGPRIPHSVGEEIIATNEAKREATRPSNQQLTAAPMVEGVTVYQWLKNNHPLKDNVWPAVVQEFYTRAASVPEVLSYFHVVLARPDGMATLQNHFLRALKIVTSTGLTQGTLDYLENKHSVIRNEAGQPITSEVYDAVIHTLLDILAEQRMPQVGLDNLATSVAPIKAVMVRA